MMGLLPLQPQPPAYMIRDGVNNGAGRGQVGTIGGNRDGGTRDPPQEKYVLNLTSIAMNNLVLDKLRPP